MWTGPITYPTIADAAAYLATVQADLVRQTWKAPSWSAETVGAYVARWIAESTRIKLSTRALYEDLHRLNIEPFPLGAIPLGDVTPDVVRTWHAELTQDVVARLASRPRHSTATSRTGQTTTAQTYRLLHSALNGAVEGELIVRNPCKNPELGRTDESERPVASLDEVAALAAAMPARYRLIVLLAAWSGARQGELFALRRSDIELGDDPSLRIAERAYVIRGRRDLAKPKSKAGVRTISLSPFLVPIIVEHLTDFVAADPDALVFTSRNGTPSSSATLTPIWHLARAKAGRPDLRFHDLRHTGQTLAALGGATQAELQARMGHSTAAASAGYSHTTREHGRDVANAMSDMATGATVIQLVPRVRRSS